MSQLLHGNWLFRLLSTPKPNLRGYKRTDLGMSQAIQSNQQAQIESIAHILPPSAQEDFRQLLRFVFANLSYLAPGGNLVQIGGSPQGSSAPPVGVTHTVTGANGVATVTISNPEVVNNKSAPIWHEISYSPLKSFTQGVMTLPPTTATSVTIAQSGVSAYYRLRSSFDKKTWSNYQSPTTGPNPVDAGLVEATAMANGAAFNQSNFAVLQPYAPGSTVAISIGGPSGTLTPYTALRGTTQSTRPSATLVGLTADEEYFVGYSANAGGQFYAQPTLASVLADGLEPVGSVTTVGSGSGTPGGGGATGGNGSRMTAV